jgi:hypothetical protein
VLNAASEEDSIAAVRSACLPFYAQGCTVAMHSCLVAAIYCDAGICRM